MSELTSDRRYELLRRHAEAIIAARSENIDLGELPSKMEDLLHELEVRQVELELQNQELRHANNEVSRLQKEYEDLYEFAPVGYVTLDNHGLVARANLTAGTLLGMDRSRLHSRALAGFFVQSDQDALRGALSDASKQRERRFADLCVSPRTGDDSSLWIRAAIDAVVSDESEDQAAGWRVALTDITEAKEAQASLAEEARQRELLSRELRHRVKNDLNLVAGMLGLHAAKSENPAVVEALRGARGRLETVARAYDALSGRTSTTDVVLSQFLGAVIDSQRGVAESAGVTVEQAIPDKEVPEKLAVSIGLIVNELLTNALKHGFAGTQAPKVTITARALPPDDPDDQSSGSPDADAQDRAQAQDRADAAPSSRRLRVTVSDNGTGFPDTALDESKLGFGLSIARTLCEQHGGTLTLANDGPDGGASVTTEMTAAAE